MKRDKNKGNTMDKKKMNQIKNRIQKARLGFGVMGSMILIYEKEAMAPETRQQLEAYLTKYPLELNYWASL